MKDISSVQLLAQVIASIREVEGNTEIVADTQLLNNSLLDSMTLLVLVSRFEEELGVTLGDEDMVPENFETPDKIAGLFAEVAKRHSH